MILPLAPPIPHRHEPLAGSRPGPQPRPASRLTEPDFELVRFACRYLLTPGHGRRWTPRADPGRPLRILEMRCGIGRHAVFFATRDCETWGCDASPGDLEVAREWSRALGLDELADRFRPTEGPLLPFADAAFDLVTCHETMQALPATAAPDVFAEVRRVLRPGGLFYCDLVDCHAGPGPASASSFTADTSEAAPRLRSPSAVWRDAARIEQLLTLGGLDLGELTLSRPAPGGPDAAHARWYARRARSSVAASMHTAA